MMVEPAVKIYEGHDFYVPQFEVYFGKSKLRKDVVRDIIQVTYRDNIAEMDSFDITINNEWSHEYHSFKYSDQEIFDPGKKLTLWMGYYGNKGLTVMITGEITSLRPTFPESGQSTLSVSGLNTLHRLTRRKQESHSYVDLTDSQIARRIAGRLEMRLVPGPEKLRDEKQYPYVLQDNQYDIVFLLERALHCGYDLYVVESGTNGQADENVLYFGPPTNKRPTYELNYGSSLIQFQPTLTTANQVEKVTVHGWDERRKRAIKGSATRNDLATNGVGSRGRQEAIDKAIKGHEEVITDYPVRDDDDAKRVARERLKAIDHDLVRGSGSTLGLPDLRAGSVVELNGLGDRFSGRYFITATTHTINDSGYTTQFECRREEMRG